MSSRAKPFLAALVLLALVALRVRSDAQDNPAPETDAEADAKAVRAARAVLYADGVERRKVLEAWLRTARIPCDAATREALNTAKDDDAKRPLLAAALSAHPAVKEAWIATLRGILDDKRLMRSGSVAASDVQAYRDYFDSLQLVFGHVSRYGISELETDVIAALEAVHSARETLVFMNQRWKADLSSNVDSGYRCLRDLDTETALDWLLKHGPYTLVNERHPDKVLAAALASLERALASGKTEDAWLDYFTKDEYGASHVDVTKIEKVVKLEREKLDRSPDKMSDDMRKLAEKCWCKTGVPGSTDEQWSWLRSVDRWERFEREELPKTRAIQGDLGGKLEGTIAELERIAKMPWTDIFGFLEGRLGPTNLRPKNTVPEAVDVDRLERILETARSAPLVDRGRELKSEQRAVRDFHLEFLEAHVRGFRNIRAGKTWDGKAPMPETPDPDAEGGDK